MKNKKQFSKFHRIILSSFLVFITAFSAQAQKSASDWNIADYFKNLPKKYITATGDFPKPTAENITVDEKNGYAAAFTDFPVTPEQFDGAVAVFQAALFKSQTKPPLLVVSNLKSDAVCDDYETFFLRRVGENWTQVRGEVLPALPLKMFWDKPQSAARFKKIVEQDNSTTYHFEPSRAGTRMKVSLEICDYFLEVTPIGQVDELTKIIESGKPIYLDWDKKNGRFKLADE
ncbi:MAG: hypothetical protein LH614_01620 [Pyrinomonadaceae bacterium]|nr:hypothetical protein [Pyrinomonadaceae bacterium]